MNAATDYFSPGFIYSTNITPDPATGIGSYTLADFKRALRDGIARDGHRLYPAMPYPSFSKMTDADIADLYAYFMKGVRPVKLRPPQTKLSFPFNQRWAMALWDLLLAPHKVWQPQTGQDALWNRGAYLVEGPGHCGACHTPRNLFYQERGYTDKSSHFLAGGILDHWFAPSLREEKVTGLGRWSEDDIVAFLKTGHTTYGTAFGAMTETIQDSLQHLNDNDLHAIAHYLKSLPANKEEAVYAPAALSRAWPPGAGIYAQFCARCHGNDGRGKSSRFPALAGNPVVLASPPGGLARLVLEGGIEAKTAAVPKPASMPGFKDKLNDDEIADVLSFIRNSWGNGAAPVTPKDVKTLRGALEKEQRQK